MSGKNTNQKVIHELENKIAELELELENARFQLEQTSGKLHHYQLVADFAFGWELWFEPDGTIIYCSPSCADLTGFSANQIMATSDIAGQLVYLADKEKFSVFLENALNLSSVSQNVEFRILTLSKQLRWVVMNTRGVYDKMGKYLGIRASIQDITRLKRAMGHISELEKSKEFDSRNKQRLQTELDLKDRELVAFLLQLSQKNDLLNRILHLVKPTDEAFGKNTENVITKIKDLLNTDVSQLIDWSVVESQIEKTFPGFLSRLQQQHPLITEKDTKLCAYVRLGLSSKEIAGLLNLTHKSVEIARVRLRKKLGLTGKKRLSFYLQNI